jgi:hypothetical protein
MVLLQFASSFLIVAGLAAVAFGYGLRDATFGHTAFVSGLIGFGAGIISLALAMSVRELRHIAELLDLNAAAPHPGTLLDLSRSAPSPRLPMPPVAEKTLPIPKTAATETSRSEIRRPLPSRPPHTQRSDAEIRRPEFAGRSISDLTGRPEHQARHERHERKDEGDDVVAREDKTLAASPSSRAGPDRMRETPQNDASPAPVEFPPVTAAPEPVEIAPSSARAAIAPTLVKSGQVNEMTYSIFSDGSIEAALPNGTMRFATLNQLRDHLNGESQSPPAVSLV